MSVLEEVVGGGVFGGIGGVGEGEGDGGII